MQRIKFSDVEVGAELPALRTKPIEHMTLVRYAGASGDFNPIHTDPAFAEKVGLGGTIAHGMFTMAQVGRMVSAWVNPIQIREFGVKFKAMSKPGQTLICTGTVKKKKEDEGKKLITVSVQAADENGEVKAAGDLVVEAD
ncbi:MaoC/PaaZ C-terminal domain-containing protein [Leptonema illini]|jgi:acyl dehydratase|uniref:MaoC domain protein dehydratase n=1 Tax=Leptonema illini DSM 21528 TaxID=929563 RepID=H2CJ61_9LEPT|nr:MaoC/PaaZ C-terminal domain-containing protein [Leptonema illini]EHQ06001.1 MaoC domain protein dehydratase [Leptonema illini DSM 21528]PKL30181.1 MAG: dehydratase [Spirochaetae bacterium HGW-Spirochaetae-10]